MTAVLGMAVACAACWLAVALLSPEHARSAFFGIAGPFSAVAGTWLLVQRAARQSPEALNGLLMTGFVVKMALFALYVVAVVRLANVDWTAFTLSFATSFIALYAVEALLLRRLIARLT
jgi:hypothetical protein